MSDGTAANWHPDPYGRHQLRYWDGTTWTEHVSNDGVAAVDPVTTAPPGAPTGRVDPIDAPPAATTSHLPPLDNPSTSDSPPPESASGTSGSNFPLIPIVAGAIVAALVVGGLIVFLGGGNDDSTTAGELTRRDPVVSASIDLDAGEGFRFVAIPRGNEDQDLAVLVALNEDDQFALRETVAPDQQWVLSDFESDDVYSEIFSDRFSSAEGAGVAEGEYYTLFETDGNGRGEAEGDFFVSPIAMTVKVFVYDYDGEPGEVELQLEKWDGNLGLGEATDYFSEVDDLLSDDTFFMSDSPFFDILSEDFDEFNETS